MTVSQLIRQSYDRPLIVVIILPKLYFSIASGVRTTAPLDAWPPRFAAFRRVSHRAACRCRTPSSRAARRPASGRSPAAWCTRSSSTRAGRRSRPPSRVACPPSSSWRTGSRPTPWTPTSACRSECGMTAADTLFKLTEFWTESPPPRVLIMLRTQKGTGQWSHWLIECPGSRCTNIGSVPRRTVF